MQGLTAAFLAYVLLFALAALFVKYPLGPEMPPSPEFGIPGQIRGAFHIHSTLSDGELTPSQIARAAKAARLQFIIITDHNLRTLAPPAFEQGVLVISGVELSTGYGHLAVVGASGGVDYFDPDPISRAQELGGLTILAHPVQRQLPWVDAPSAARTAGMEVYSAQSLFRDAFYSPLTLLLPAAAAYLANPMHGLMILDRGQPEATQKLLEISAREPKLALCAHDAHGFPPYELVFRAFSLHLPLAGALKRGLPADADEAARTVIDTIARGDAYCAFDALGSAAGFDIDGLSESSRRAAVGDRVAVRLPPTPLQTRVQVWGGARLEPDGRTVLFERPGPVQIEVWAAAPGRLFGTTWKPWIIPSPIFVSPPPARLGTDSSGGEPPVSIDSPPEHERMRSERKKVLSGHFEK